MSEQREKATPRRKQKAREEGQFVRSRELSSALVMLSGVLLLGVFSTAFVSGWRGILYSSLSAAQSGDLSLEASERRVGKADGEPVDAIERSVQLRQS